MISRMDVSRFARGSIDNTLLLPDKIDVFYGSSPVGMVWENKLVYEGPITSGVDIIM